MKALALVVLVAALGACYDPGTPCGDGYCGTGAVCTPAGDRCVFPQQLVDCLALPDGEACVVPGGREGICAAQVCRQVVCGDGVVEGSEQCDGTNLDGATDCSALGDGYHPGGTLSCTNQCRFDPETCSGRCGDGIVQPGVETCDRSVGELTCRSQGFRGGTLACGADCQLDVRGCEGRCGDGVRTGDEQCDRTDFGDNTCSTFGFYEGVLRCSATCQVETTTCAGRCGDDRKNGPEICDGPDLGGLSCQTYGWHGGTLGCGDDCLSVDRSACEEYCGDGIKNGNEQCDGLDHDGDSCTTLGAVAGALGCDAFCQPTTDACYWGTWRPVTATEETRYRAVWARSPRDIWASTDDDHLRHFDGAGWRSVDIGLASWVLTFWWSPEGYLWARTVNGELAYHDGHTWTIAHRGLVDVTITATSPRNVWVADVGVVRHFDGEVWSDIAMPDAEAWVERIVATADGTTWFVMFDRILQLDATGWTEHELDGMPFCLWAMGNDVYTNVFSWDGRDVVYRRDGTGWTRFEVPDLEGVTCGWSDSDDRMWIAGTIDDRDKVLRLDPDASWLIAADDVFLERAWAHGGHLWSHGEDILRIDGPPWASRGAPIIDDVRAIQPTSAGSAWIGADGGLHRVVSGEPLASFPVTGTAWAVWTSGVDVWVGGDVGVLRLTADGFQREGSATLVTALRGTAADDIWTISLDGSVHHYDGVAWSLTDHFSAPRTADSQLTGTDPSNWWARYGARTYRREAGAWVEVELIDSHGYSPIATTGPTDHWVFGAGGAAYQHDGEVATMLPVPWRAGETSIWAETPRSVWVAAGRDLYHYDGAAWSPVRLPGPRFAAEIAGGHGTVWVGGARGALYNLPARLPTAERGACAPALPAYCNVPVRGHTAATDDGPIDCNEVAHPGGELHYEVHVPINGTLTATVTSRFPVDIAAVTADAAGDCDVTACVQRGPATVVTRTVRQGETYVLTVGAADEPAPFTLAIDCVKE